MSEYPETHVVEIDRPKDMPLKIKGMFHRGKLKWFSFCVIGPDGEVQKCELPDEEDELILKAQELLHVVYIESEKLNRKPRLDNRR